METHYSWSKRGFRFLPVLFIFIKVSPITMLVAGHYKEGNQRKKQGSPSQRQRPSLQQVLPLPPLQDSGHASAVGGGGRRRLVVPIRSRISHWWRRLSMYLWRWIIVFKIWHVMCMCVSVCGSSLTLRIRRFRIFQNTNELKKPRWIRRIRRRNQCLLLLLLFFVFFFFQIKIGFVYIKWQCR